MILALILLIVASVSAAPHSGATAGRTSPELSDIALFIMAAGGIWFVRRALRARFARRRAEAPPKPQPEGDAAG